MLADALSPHGSNATLASVGTLSEGFERSPLYLVGRVRWDARSDQSSFVKQSLQQLSGRNPTSGLLAPSTSDLGKQRGLRFAGIEVDGGRAQIRWHQRGDHRENECPDRSSFRRKRGADPNPETRYSTFCGHWSGIQHHPVPAQPEVRQGRMREKCHGIKTGNVAISDSATWDVVVCLGSG